jgi:hypothetical protein
MRKFIVLLLLFASVSCAENMSTALARGCTPVMLPPGQSLNGLLTQSGVITNGAIPGPGCTDLGTSVNLVLSGATVAYVANPTGIYTVSVATAASRYCYSLEVASTNSYTLAAGLTLMGSHTIGKTNIFVTLPHTGTVWRVYPKGL